MNIRRMKWSIFLVLFCTAAGIFGIAFGPEKTHAGEPAEYSAAITSAHQFRTDLDCGGRYDMSGIALRSSVTKPVTERVSVGFGLAYAYEEYDFKNPAFTMGVSPWSELHHVQGSFLYARMFDNQWKLTVSPSLGYAGESDADTSDSLVWGGVVSFTKQVNPNLVIGAGIGYSDGVDKRSVMPVVMIQWDVSANLSLANTPSTSPWGPAGLELSYRIDDGWTIGTGVAWHERRFRLDEDGFSPGGVGIISGVPGWLRISRSFSRGWNVDIYSGAVFSGEFRVEDAAGMWVTGTDCSTAPFISGVVSISF